MNCLLRFIPLQSFTSVIANRTRYSFGNFHMHLDSKEILYFGKNTKANIEISKDYDYYNNKLRESIEIRNTILVNNVPTYKNQYNYLIYEKINISINTFYGFNVDVKYNLDIMTNEKLTNETINEKIVGIDLFEVKFEKNNYPILLNLEQYYSAEVLELQDYIKLETLKP